MIDPKVIAVGAVYVITKGTSILCEKIVVASATEIAKAVLKEKGIIKK